MPATTPNTRKSARPGRSPALAGESAVWRCLPDAWRKVYGGFHDFGVSVEWHDFEAKQDFDWSRSFHPQSVELCLNLSGNAAIERDERTLTLGQSTAAFYRPGRQGLRARRMAGQRHRFATLEFSAPFLRSQLARCDGGLHPLIADFLRGDTRAGVGESRRLTPDQEQWAERLRQPPVYQAARPLWYQSRVLDFMADFFFDLPQGDELFCDRQKRLARERSDRVIALLREQLTEPPSLQEIGREVGCSPFHLSRTFSREKGMTIPQYLRKLRMERAAELLRTGRFNVTEVAMEVGYSSLSHFSLAFCQSMGCCPALYPLKKAAAPGSAE